MKKCPCGSEKEFDQCCRPLLEGLKPASTPEELMRSRYTAFVLQKMAYIEMTTDPQTRLDFDMKANEDWARSSRFLGLEILKCSQDGNKGLVEFKAHFQVADQAPQVHHEVSKFRQQGGVCYFREGKIKS